MKKSQRGNFFNEADTGSVEVWDGNTLLFRLPEPGFWKQWALRCENCSHPESTCMNGNPNIDAMNRHLATDENNQYQF